MLDERRKNYPNILASIKALEITAKKSGEILDKVLLILNGNGEVGLVAEVKGNTADVQELKTDRKVTLTKVFDWSLRAVMTGVVIYLTTK